MSLPSRGSCWQNEELGGPLRSATSSKKGGQMQSDWLRWEVTETLHGKAVGVQGTRGLRDQNASLERD